MRHIMIACLLMGLVSRVDCNISLQPDMPSIANPGVPMLEEKIIDADVTQDAGLSVEPEHLYTWVFEPERPVGFTVKSTADHAKLDSAILTVWDWENHPIAQKQFNSPFSEKIAFDVLGRGTYVLTLDGVKDGKCAYRLVRSFSVCPTNEKKRALWEKSGFWIGQCSFPGRHGLKLRDHFAYPPGFTEDQSRELDANLVARMGVQVARIDLPVIRRDNDGFDLDFTLADKCVKAFASRGLKLDLHLFGPYGSGAGPVLDKYADAAKKNQYIAVPLKEKPYRYFVHSVAERYGKYAAFFQIGNEPGNEQQYLGTSDEFVNTERQSIDEIRRIYPHATITNGGYCFTNKTTQEIIDTSRGLTDFISYHWHGDLPGLKTFYGQIQELHQKAEYQKPKYANTEMGYHTSCVGAEKTNAVYELQKLLYCWAHGNSGVLLYSSRELFWPRQYNYDGLTDYGFVDYFFCPRFVYGAISAFIDHYAGFKFERTLIESDNLYAYQFKRGRNKMVAIFTVHKPVTIKLASDAKTAMVIDPMGNEKQALDSQAITIKAGEYPQTILFSDAKKIELVL